ncbi:MAG: hypothetical protein JSR73_09420 [Proteobacteria bacterium]|nr:hypothetical protein [Pseudomonadota bacterium]
MIESNNGAASRPLTLGAVAERLRGNGYEPTSALFPFGRLTEDFPLRYGPWPTHLVSEHPPAIVLRHPLAVLILNPIGDPELNERARAVLTQNGLLQGPVRLGSDGGESRPLRLGEPFQRLQSMGALNGAIALDQQQNDGIAVRSSLLPLDGHWPDGDLLSVGFDDLPEFSGMAGLMRELDQLSFAIANERAPPRKPSRLGFVGR